MFSATTTQTSDQNVSSTTILAPGKIVTGVRGMDDSNVVLTGSGSVNGITTAFLYVGPPSPTNDAGMYALPPVFDGQTVTASTYYGPDTFKFNPGLGAGNVRAVGSYQYADSGARNHGMMYEGPPAGGGVWTQIDVPPGAVGGQSVANTIAHSTMGDLVVGNYDLHGDPLSANAFIYNVTKGTWTLFDFGDDVSLITAYGIWQNEIGGAAYTIVGGAKDGAGLNKGFLVRYDSETGSFSQLTWYTYNNDPAVVTHFEGITAVPGGFHLAGGSGAASATFIFIPVKPDGSFGEAAWTPFAFPGAELTTGNTIYRNLMMGLYVLPDKAGTGTYLATFG